MKTQSISQTEINEKWYIIDATGQRIGRIATIAAELLMGKNDPLTRSNLDPKSKVVIVNAGRIDFTAKRGFSKFYKSYSGFPGGLSFESLEEKFKKDKTFPLENAIKGMLPKNKRGRMLIANLKLFEGVDHSHDAQKPVTIDINKYKI